MFQLNYNYYTDIDKFIDYISGFKYTKNYKRVTNKTGYYVYNIPVSFDIETSSFYDTNNKKCALMYIWQLSFNGNVVIGRTWEQFIYLCQKLSSVFNLSEKLILYIYVHNLSYEFQFIKDIFKWNNVFAVDDRKPIKALTDLYIQFMDSYILSGYSLETVGKHLQKYKVQKLSGFLDYEKIRTPQTRLTDKEIQYCINDVQVVVAYIQEYIESVGNITQIPLTQTGRIRKLCRKNCFNGFEKKVSRETYFEYRKLMNELTLDLPEYELLKRCFMGGFTHANALYVNKTMQNVSSYDFTSSYPYVMLSEKFPMGKGFRVDFKDKKEYEKYKKLFLMIFDCELIGVSEKIKSDNPISSSHCWKLENEIINNGRVAYADRIVTSCTNIDLDIYEKFYNIESINIWNVYCYAPDYLPKNFILTILKLYNNKTQLKGVVGKEKEYLHSKELLNSLYGMSVTAVCQDLITYDNNKKWYTEYQDKEKQIEKYNKNKSRFLFYPWGVFVTAYARKNLFSAIYEMDYKDNTFNSDYIYSDTDSVKIINADKHKKYFDTYNQNVYNKLLNMCNHYNIDISLCKPHTIKGIEKLIGVWDFEGTYKYFKTLGAKRYIYKDNDLHCTVAGVSKSGIKNYMVDTYKTDKEIFNNFCDDLKIPDNYTHKLTHTYIDDRRIGNITDIQGNLYHYDIPSCIHLEKTEFKLSMGQAFIDFIKGVQTNYVL